MEAIAEELSEKCGLTLYALPHRVGGGHNTFGIVLFDNSMAPANRTSEDAEVLLKLERLLESIGISKTPKVKFELLCTAAYKSYPFEPEEMAEREPPTEQNSRDRILHTRIQEASVLRTKERGPIPGERFGRWGTIPSEEMRGQEWSGAYL